MMAIVLRALVLLLAASACTAFAQSYPVKAVRVIVPYSPGGPLDDVMRVVGNRLTEMWGLSVLVDNRTGAGGSIGADYVAKSAPDGYTLLLGNAGPMTINPGLQKKLPYDAQRDFAPVSQLTASPMVLVVHPSMPVKTVPDLVRVAKARSGQLIYASAGIGNLQHLGMEALQTMAGIRMNHVPYKGAPPALIDVMSGQVQLMFANIVGVLQHIRSGKVRAIAVSSVKRAGTLPDVPSVADSYPEFDATGWTGVFAPAGTPKDVIAKLHADITSVLVRPDIRERFTDQGAEVVASSPEQLAAFVRRESALYAKIIQSSGIKVD
ncbi:MAG: tripartite tricarboxylate transporter substrate binding protein [Betaproteobacteria bacterium]|nr:tripartite tricarboxylate transporter substrate binding protein [Betaproteobacteria bacterium]